MAELSTNDLEIVRVYQEEKARVDAWIAHASRAWDATHATDEAWQHTSAAARSAGGSGMAYDPNQPDHLTAKADWVDGLPSVRAAAVTAMAKEHGVVRDEVWARYEALRASGTAPGTPGKPLEGLDYLAGIAAASQERARQDALAYTQRLSRETPEDTRQRVTTSLTEIRHAGAMQDRGGDWEPLAARAVTAGVLSERVVRDYTAERAAGGREATLLARLGSADAYDVSRLADLAGQENAALHAARLLEQTQARKSSLGLDHGLGW